MNDATPVYSPRLIEQAASLFNHRKMVAIVYLDLIKEFLKIFHESVVEARERNAYAIGEELQPFIVEKLFDRMRKLWAWKKSG